MILHEIKLFSEDHIEMVSPHGPIFLVVLYSPSSKHTAGHCILNIFRLIKTGLLAPQAQPSRGDHAPPGNF